MKSWFAATAVFAAILGFPANAAAQASPPFCVNCDDVVVGGTDTGTVAAQLTRGVSDRVPGRGVPETHGDAPGRREWRTVEEELAPACTGNTRGGADLLCPFAVSSCPGDDQLRYWVWHRETVHTRDEAGVVTSVQGEWVQEPGSFCLGPDDPGVPTIGQVIAQVQTGFRSLPLPVAGIEVAPAPVALVNVPTAFYAGGVQAARFTPTILGTRVMINATPSSWSWTWGDGSSQVTSTPGVPKRPVVSHLYTRARDVQVSVATTWTGTFTVAGSAEVFPIRTPAIVQSPPVTVQVRQARTQLVAR